MGELLVRELTASEDIILDGIFGEAVHVLCSKVARPSGSWKFAFRAAGVRLEQKSFEFGMEPSTMCGEVGLVSRPHLLFGGVRSVTTVLKKVEEEQQGLKEIEGE